MRFALTIAAVAALAACQPAENEEASPELEEQSDAESGTFADAREAVFQCGGRWVEARLTEERARLVVSTMTFDLRRADAGSEAGSAAETRYEAAGDADTYFLDRGETAVVSLNGDVLPECERAGG